MIIMQLSYKYRAYPAGVVEARLFHNLDLCRWLYNTLLGILSEHRRDWELSKQDTQDAITQIKLVYPFLNDVHSKVLQMVNYTLWSNIKSLSKLKKNGHRNGRLKYKHKGNYNTLTYNQSGFSVDGEKHTAWFSKIGTIPFDMHRPLPEVGTVKGVVITRKDGKWYVAMQVEVPGAPENDMRAIMDAEEQVPEELLESKKIVGIDVGVTSFVKDYDGEEHHEVENSKYLGQKLDKLRFLQKSLSRKEKGSNKRMKARKLMAKLHENARNVRNNRNHQESRKLVDRYDVIVVEDLDIMGMVSRQHRISKLSPKARRTLRRNILDAGWGDFVHKLRYKTEKAGKLLLKVCPRNTTQRCSHCGAIVYKDITKRTHKCPYCGLEMDRDENAALNIRMEGIMLMRAGNRPEPDGEVCHCPVEQPGKHTPMKQEATAFRPR
jgi:putative transposase